MAKFELEEMSLDELRALQRDVKKAIDSYEDRRRKEALSAVTKAAKEAGYSLEELVGGKRSGKAAKVSVPKYVHPENPELTWSGRGRRPAWISEGLEQGKSLEDFRIGKR